MKWEIETVFVIVMRKRSQDLLKTSGLFGSSWVKTRMTLCPLPPTNVRREPYTEIKKKI